MGVAPSKSEDDGSRHKRLEDACIRLCLPSEGTTEELYERLRRHIEGTESSEDNEKRKSAEASEESDREDADSSEEEDEEDAPTPGETYTAAARDLKAVKKPDLVAACKTLGLTSSGTKEDLYGRLHTHFGGSSGGGAGAAPPSPGGPASSFVLREAVAMGTDDVFDFREDVDLYTMLEKKEVVKRAPQIDHVLDTRLLNVVYKTGLKDAGVAARTRAAATRGAEMLNDVINNVINLDVTTQTVRQAKAGPFRAFVNRLEKGDGDVAWGEGETCFEDLARNSKSSTVRSLVDQGTLARIGKAVVKVYDDLEVHVESKKADLGVHGDALMDGLERAINAMKLDA